MLLTLLTLIMLATIIDYVLKTLLTRITFNLTNPIYPYKSSHHTIPENSKSLPLKSPCNASSPNIPNNYNVRDNHTLYMLKGHLA